MRPGCCTAHTRARRHLCGGTGSTTHVTPHRPCRHIGCIPPPAHRTRGTGSSPPAPRAPATSTVGKSAQAETATAQAGCVAGQRRQRAGHAGSACVSRDAVNQQSHTSEQRQALTWFLPPSLPTRLARLNAPWVARRPHRS
eukprot:356902-Chlamydomonas_euryale.AAC.17